MNLSVICSGCLQHPGEVCSIWSDGGTSTISFHPRCRLIKLLSAPPGLHIVQLCCSSSWAAPVPKACFFRRPEPPAAPDPGSPLPVKASQAQRVASHRPWSVHLCLTVVIPSRTPTKQEHKVNNGDESRQQVSDIARLPKRWVQCHLKLIYMHLFIQTLDVARAVVTM